MDKIHCSFVDCKVIVCVHNMTQEMEIDITYPPENKQNPVAYLLHM